jgi:hypothetical protein
VRRDLVTLKPIPGKGRGVVAIKPIPKGTLIEAAAVIRMKKRDRLDRSTVLSEYPFEWPDPPYVQAFVLGWIALLNHDDKPNCRSEVDVKQEVIRCWTTVDVPKGAELTHSYGIEPWFKIAK